MGYIVEIQQFKKAFSNAHTRLLAELADEGKLMTITDSELRQIWKDRYLQTIITGQAWAEWTAIDFKTQEQYTMFLLKYS